MAQEDFYTERIRSGVKAFHARQLQHGQSGTTQPSPARGLQSGSEPASFSSQATPTTQPIVILQDTGAGGEVSTLKAKVASLEERVVTMEGVVAGMGATEPEPVIELRDIPYEDAKAEIKQYFEDHHGEEIDGSDLQENLGIELEIAIQICDELEREGAIKTP